MALIFAALFLPLLTPPLLNPVPPVASALSDSLVISQVYGGGGNSGATYSNDFIELFNRGNTTVSLDGWSVQYASASGNFDNTNNGTNLPPVMLLPGQYFLVQEFAGAVSSLALPNPDVITGTINLSATDGKVALVNSTTSLNCGNVSTSCTPAQLATIVDLLGYGTTSGSLVSEGISPTPKLSNTKAALRLSNGCTDTDNNSTDFAIGTPSPRNSSSPIAPCGSQPIIPNCGGPLNTEQGTLATRTLSATDIDGLVITATITGLTPDPAPGTILLTEVIPATRVGGLLTATLTVSAAVPVGSYNMTLNFTNTDSPTPQAATCSFNVTVYAPAVLTPIYTIQGAALQSPLSGVVTTDGVVTGLKSNGFFIQDPLGDGDINTSDGLFIYFGTTPGVAVGHRVRVTGTIKEYRSTSRPEDATLTELESVIEIIDLGVGQTITPVIISTDPARTGPQIRRPPLATIYSTSNYDPAVDGLDFYESLEGMLVEVDTPLVVGETDSFSGEFVVLPDNGIGTTGLTSRGAIAISEGDFNPERIFVGSDDLAIGSNPKVAVGDRITASIIGPLDYTFGAFKIQTRTKPGFDSSQRPTPETIAPLTNPDYLRVASYNLANFSPSAGGRIQQVADHIRVNLGGPDILVLLEVEDDSGATDNGVVISDANLNGLASAITSAGGPLYTYAYISPLDKQDGGLLGGNIRQVFFYRTDRGLSFISRGNAGPTDANTVNPDGSLQFSPGRIDPTNVAFTDSRKPLAGEFSFNGQRLIVIGNHFNSRSGDDPLYGVNQPPKLSSETRRREQANLVRAFVNQLISADSGIRVIVAGDLNEFEFAPPLKILKNGEGTLSGNQILTDAIEDPSLAGERYTYIFEGNAQVLDHLLYSPTLLSQLVKADIVHFNSGYLAPVRASDHEAVVADFSFSLPCSNPLVVSKATDDGSCGTLSYAIPRASSGQVITFQNLPGGITLKAPLPLLPEGVSLDGTCTADSVTGRGRPRIWLNAGGITGPQLGGLLRLTTNNTINGLSITGYIDYAIEISGNNNTITCNWLGTSDGITKNGNGGGIRFKNTAFANTVGLTGDKSSGNLISGNANFGILADTTPGPANRFYYNLFGCTKNGILPLRNGKPFKSTSGSRFSFGPGNKFL
ncbi:MAG: lamin tail domain-containing protein [Chloroflexi bacterium]|nr:lamin tail domain-containing protein [Chloroflexota bacterium]